MIERIATPGVGVAAIAFVLVLGLASGAGPIAGSALLVVLAAAGVAFARSRARAPRRNQPPVIERIGGCGLGPGVAVHAIRVADRVLVVGVTGSSIALLETATSDEFPGTERATEAQDSPTPASAGSRLAPILRRAGLALALAAGLAAAAGVASADQSDSTRQAADLGTGSRSERTAAREPGRSSVAPPLEIPPAPAVELPSPGTTPLGPMLWLAALAMLPFALMGMTSFVKISVVLSLLRSALGTPQVPSDPLLAGIALALTSFVMAPVATEVWERVGASNADLSTAGGVLTAASAAAPPVRGFLERNSRPDEVALFVTLSAREGRAAADPGSFAVLIPAFVTSELREAFVAGFFLFIPFLVVDLVVSNILMSMGMVMVSPTTVSLPFKILLFVLVDGWDLVTSSLVKSFN